MSKGINLTSKVMVLVCLVLASTGVLAQEHSGKVAVVPFTIHSQEKPQNIQNTITELLIRQFAAENIQTVEPTAVGRVIKPGEAVSTEETARDIGRRLRTDYVLFGSFNQIGNSISLDAKLVDVAGRKSTQALFAEERGMENLASAAKGIVQQASVNVLSKAIIAEIRIRGNDRIEADAIKSVVKSKKGEVIRPEQVRDDIKAIYKMGFFENVEAEESDVPAGRVLTFVVQENPTISEVKISGNSNIKEKDILAAVSTKAYTVLQKNVVSEDVQKIIKVYHQKGYYGAEVTSSVEFPKNPRNAVVVFNIKEHGKVYIQKITFKGNKHFSARQLRGAMQTKEKTFVLSWFTERGTLQKEILDADVDRLTVFYHDKGYMDAKVGTPEVNRRDNGFYIEVPIDEGERYKVTSVDVKGVSDEDAKDILKNIETKPSGYFGREKLRHDIDYITKKYMNIGYAYTDVNPDVKRDTVKQTAQVTFQVKKGEIVHIGTVYITGNTKTRDKVIRRELKLAEGDTFDGSKLEKSITNLKKLDFFEDVQVTPSETGQKDVMNLQVKVKEKLTGSISMGGGYSSDDGLFATGQVMERNLFGKGEYVALKAYFGASAERYIFSFTEPWIFDYPVAAGFDIYNWQKDYSDFSQRSTGIKLRASYLFGNYSHLNAAYTFENSRVTDVDTTIATPYVLSQEGDHLKGSITLGIERDSTDHPFMPTKGSVNGFSVEYASKTLGGDSDFVKSEVHSGWYFPIVWKLVGHLRGQAGYIYEPNGEIPIYERFFLGGINSLRAFKWGEVGPRDSAGEYVGGLEYGVLSGELLFPLIEKLGIRGVVFLDTGNAFDGGSAAADLKSFDISQFRTDAGLGIRWQSPLGPLRVEWGYNLDRKPGEKQSQFQFSAGAFF